MRSKHEIPNKFDIMKQHCFNFLLNEKFFSDVVHENNAKRVTREVLSDSNQQNRIVATSQEVQPKEAANKLDFARLYKEKKGDQVHAGIITETKTDYTGSTAKKYTTRCFIKPKAVPVWYNESVLIHINSTRKRFEEKIYFKNEILPFRWVETMLTESNQDLKRKESPLPQEKPEVHYSSHNSEKTH